MPIIQSGILDKTRLISNILMLVLLVGNIYFSIQYTEGLKRERDEAASSVDGAGQRIQTAKFLKLFVDVVLNSGGEVSFDDRVKLENDVRQLGDPQVTAQWEAFVGSSDPEAAQEEAVKLMRLLANMMV